MTSSGAAPDRQFGALDIDSHTIETPSLVLDRMILARNAARMTERFKALGLRLRPHMKTAKSIEVARCALAGNFGGVTVSTLKEAEYFAEHGIRDITYAISIMPDKLPRIARLIHAGVQLSVVTDNVSIAQEISRRAVELGIVLDVLIELELGREARRPDAGIR